MNYRKIPGTRLEVSEVAFNVGTLSSEYYKNNERNIHHLIRYGLDRGINFFGASDFRGAEGRAEKLLGDALYEERDRVVLTTITDGVFDQYEQFKAQKKRKFSPKKIKHACEESLRRLRTDRIDLYQIHYPDISSVEYDDLYALLKKLKRQGKIRSWGGYFGPETGWLEEATLLTNLRKPATLQMNFNLLEAEYLIDFLPVAEKKQVGLLASVPHCNSVLTDGDLWEQNSVLRKKDAEWFEKKVKETKKFEFLAERGIRTLGQAALKFVLSAPSVVSAFADIYDEEQLNEYVAVGEKENLSPAELKKVYALYQQDTQVESAGDSKKILES